MGGVGTTRKEGKGKNTPQHKGEEEHHTTQKKVVPPLHRSLKFLAHGNTCTSVLCDEMWVPQTGLLKPITATRQLLLILFPPV